MYEDLYETVGILQVKIVIHAWYPKIVPVCEHFIHKFWSECPYELVVVGTDTKIDTKIPVVYLGKNLNYASNMIRFLDNHYDEEFFISWMEDYILSGVHPEPIRLVDEFITNSPGIACIRLSKHFTPQDVPSSLGPTGLLSVIDKCGRYSLSLQITMWRTSVFRSLLKEGENPWQTEIRGSSRVAQVKGTFLGARVPMIENQNYYRKQKFKPGVDEWVKAHW